MNKRSFLFITMLLYSQTTFAQTGVRDLPGNYFNFGTGYTLSQFLDNSFSTLRYRGHAAALAGGFHFNHLKNRHHLDLRFDYGEATNNTNAAAVRTLRFEGNYVYERYVRNLWQERLRWFMGGSVNGLWQLWIFDNFSNNAYNNSIYLSLSPHTSLTYDFTLLRRSWTAGFNAFLPVVTFAIRPFYGASSFSGFLDRENDNIVAQIIESGRLTSFNKFFRFSNTFFLEYPLTNGNRLRLSYTWNVLRYSEPRRVVVGSHNISVATMFKF